MPMCGFNQKMLEGLSLFAEGLFDQAIKRSNEDSLSLEESLKQEILEMDIFREILDSKGERFQVLKGLTLIAQDMYKQGLGGTHEEIKEHFFEAAAQERDFCVKLDNEYYENLRPNFGPIKALHKLSRWLDENVDKMSQGKSSRVGIAAVALRTRESSTFQLSEEGQANF
jgi:hypothetical protein